MCGDWDVRALVNHIVSGNLWVPELVGGKSIADVGDRLDGDVLGDDPVAAYDASADVAAAAFRAPGAMDAPVGVSYGPVPGSIYCGHRFLDVLIHGWDVARSTGQDTTLDPQLVEACWEVVEPQAEMLAGSGMFGTASSAPAGADRQTALLVMLGRSALSLRLAGSATSLGAPMGQEITVTARQGSSPTIMMFDCNRSITGMAIERYASLEDTEGSRPPDVLARRLFDLGATRVTVYSSAVTVEAPEDGLARARGARSRRRSSTCSATTATKPAGRPTRCAPSASSPSSHPNPPPTRPNASPIGEELPRLRRGTAAAGYPLRDARSGPSLDGSNTCSIERVDGGDGAHGFPGCGFPGCGFPGCGFPRCRFPGCATQPISAPA